ncbi:hypothetical protein ILUMI_12151 [Ignelater luminosus]|uniref:Uncharacterized protein n=1 Tax=Ignelater luminosus TaxID=2038154 RepID=A0A8K0CX16_IGNLU|nr:hypothetical protein ILUMI_12151 [Ignelater luminosus]
MENIGFQRINEIFENKLNKLESKNQTSRLWVSYFRMVSVLKDFIAADRMGDWNLHLHTIERMIPFFHSSGHFPYAKAAQMYLQHMQELPTKMDPANFKKFTGGYFTARRSDVFSSGISTDQTIEQTLMKSMSVGGGPFKRGVTESVDVDVLVLLTALSPIDREIYFQKPAKGKIPQKLYSSKCLETVLPKCKQHILFLHSFTGCDTTSAFFQRGKNVFAKNLEKRPDLQNAAAVFKNECKDANDIFNAGVTCALALYAAPQKIQDLNTLWYNSFVKATAKNSYVKLPSLSPTADAAFGTSKEYTWKFKHGSEETYYQKNGVGNMKAEY